MSEPHTQRLRLFLDANVLISAAWKDGSKVARIWHIQDVQLITSEYVLGECRRNLLLPHQRQRLERLMLAVRVFSTPDGAALKDVPPELPAKDLPVLVAAVLARADFLVTGDIRHFGKWYGTSVLGIRIEPPGSFPQILEIGSTHPGY
jgi:predicted nucleic acid-binding protein